MSYWNLKKWYIRIRLVVLIKIAYVASKTITLILLNKRITFKTGSHKFVHAEMIANAAYREHTSFRFHTSASRAWGQDTSQTRLAHKARYALPKPSTPVILNHELRNLVYERILQR